MCVFFDNLKVNQSQDYTTRLLAEKFLARLIQLEKRGYYFHSYIIITLNCPITKKRLSIPTRGSKCKHVECFDLKGYIFLNYQTKTPDWLCPICNVKAMPNQLVVDTYIALILIRCNEEKIQFNEHLKWSICFNDIQYIDADVNNT